MIEALSRLPVQVALLAHPRLVARASQFGIELNQGAIRAGHPLPYADLVGAVIGSAGVVTDSGGLQKEAYLLGRAVHDPACGDRVGRDPGGRLERPRAPARTRPEPRSGPRSPPGTPPSPSDRRTTARGDAGKQAVEALATAGRPT